MNKQTKWTIDQAHSEIAFKVRHLMIAFVKGSFTIFDGSIYTTNNNFLTAQIDIAIDPNSLTTGNEKRDEHLKNSDFFDTHNHKVITFTSSNIGNADTEGNHELWGELTMKGITKKIKLNVEFGGIANDSFGKEKAGFTITGKINRSEWGLVWNTTTEAGGVLVSDEIKIMCEMELTNAQQSYLTMELKENTAEQASI